jgi:hypothetical protein
MNSKNINDLPEITELEDNALFEVLTDGVNRSVSFKTLRLILNVESGDSIGVEPITLEPGIKAGDPLEGGYYAGANIVVDGQEYALIVAPKSQGGEHGHSAIISTSTVIHGTTRNDGVTNTELFLATENSPAADFVSNLSINGFNDWYIPSIDEMEICYRYLKPSTLSNHITSGLNSNSNPIGEVYTSNDPMQTASLIFQAGNNEAFTADNDWYIFYNSSTNHQNGNIFKGMGHGTEYLYPGSHHPSTFTRAVRRVPIS